MGYSKTLAVGDSFEFGSTLYQPDLFSTVATTRQIGSITLPSIGGTIKSVYLTVYIGRLYNSFAGSNLTDGAQTIVVNNGGADVTAITVPDQSLWCPLATSVNPGCTIVGSTDVKAAFSLGGTTTVSWKNSKTTANNLYLFDVCVTARVVLT